MTLRSNSNLNTMRIKVGITSARYLENDFIRLDDHLSKLESHLNDTVEGAELNEVDNFDQYEIRMPHKAILARFGEESHTIFPENLSLKKAVKIEERTKRILQKISSHLAKPFIGYTYEDFENRGDEDGKRVVTKAIPRKKRGISANESLDDLQPAPNTRFQFVNKIKVAIEESPVYNEDAVKQLASDSQQEDKLEIWSKEAAEESSTEFLNEDSLEKTLGKGLQNFESNTEDPKLHSNNENVLVNSIFRKNEDLQTEQDVEYVTTLDDYVISKVKEILANNVADENNPDTEYPVKIEVEEVLSSINGGIFENEGTPTSSLLRTIDVVTESSTILPANLTWNPAEKEFKLKERPKFEDIEAQTQKTVKDNSEKTNTNVEEENKFKGATTDVVEDLEKSIHVIHEDLYSEASKIVDKGSSSDDMNAAKNDIIFDEVFEDPEVDRLQVKTDPAEEIQSQPRIEKMTENQAEKENSRQTSDPKEDHTEEIHSEIQLDNNRPREVQPRNDAVEEVIEEVIENLDVPEEIEKLLQKEIEESFDSVPEHTDEVDVKQVNNEEHRNIDLVSSKSDSANTISEIVTNPAPKTLDIAEETKTDIDLRIEDSPNAISTVNENPVSEVVENATPSILDDCRNVSSDEVKIGDSNTNSEVQKNAITAILDSKVEILAEETKSDSAAKKKDLAKTILETDHDFIPAILGDEILEHAKTVNAERKDDSETTFLDVDQKSVLDAKVEVVADDTKSDIQRQKDPGNSISEAAGNKSISVVSVEASVVSNAKNIAELVLDATIVPHTINESRDEQRNQPLNEKAVGTLNELVEISTEPITNEYRNTIESDIHSKQEYKSDEGVFNERETPPTSEAIIFRDEDVNIKVRVADQKDESPILYENTFKSEETTNLKTEGRINPDTSRMQASLEDIVFPNDDNIVFPSGETVRKVEDSSIVHEEVVATKTTKEVPIEVTIPEQKEETNYIGKTTSSQKSDDDKVDLSSNDESKITKEAIKNSKGEAFDNINNHTENISKIDQESKSGIEPNNKTTSSSEERASMEDLNQKNTRNDENEDSSESREYNEKESGLSNSELEEHSKEDECSENKTTTYRNPIYHQQELATETTPTVLSDRPEKEAIKIEEKAPYKSTISPSGVYQGRSMLSEDIFNPDSIPFRSHFTPTKVEFSSSEEILPKYEDHHTVVKSLQDSEVSTTEKHSEGTTTSKFFNEDHSSTSIRAETNPTNEIIESIVEAAELTTELHRFITTFRSSFATDEEIPYTTTETSKTADNLELVESKLVANEPMESSSVSYQYATVNLAVIILTSVVILFVILSLVLIVFLKFRNQEGTLDIQMEEQRRNQEQLVR